MSGRTTSERVSRVWVHDDDLVALNVDGVVVDATGNHRFGA